MDKLNTGDTALVLISAVLPSSRLIQGNLKLFGVQVLAVAVTATYSFAVTYLILRFLNIFEPVRVSQEIEAQGLDQTLHGETAYDLA